MVIDEDVIGLNKKIVELEEHLDRLIKDKIRLTEEVMGLKARYSKVKMHLDKWAEEEDIWAEIGIKKRKLDLDIEAVAKLREAQACVEALKRTLGERDGRIQELEMEACKLEDKNSENIVEAKRYRNAPEDKKKRYLQAQLKEKRKLEVAAKKPQRGNESLLEERKRMEESRGKILGLMKRVGALEVERDRMVTLVSELKEELSVEAERNLEMNKRVEESQRENKTLQAKVAKISSEKKAIEELNSKKVSTLMDKIEALIKDRREAEESACRASREKEAEIARIWKEREDMETIMSEREEAIKMFDRENQALEARIKELEKELKLEEGEIKDVE